MDARRIRKEWVAAMCLAIPGQVVAIDDAESLLKMATVDFSGVRKQISLAYIDDARVGDFVLVHVGFAISKIDEAEAQRVFDALDSLGAIDLDDPSPPGPENAPANSPLGRFADTADTTDTQTPGANR